MLRNFYLLLASVLLTASFSFGQSGVGTIRGAVTEKESGDPLPFVNVVLFQNGVQKSGGKTDFDGKFQINSIDPGKYDIEVRFVGYQTLRKEGVIVSSDKITFLNDLQIGQSDGLLSEVEVIHYQVPLIDKDGGASGQTVTREDIARMPVRSAAGVAGTVGGVQVNEGDGGMSVRGSRTSDSYYFIDGIKVRGSSNLPKSAIQEVSVVTGGLPANYGDMTGGVISVTTRGPSAKYFGSFEAVTSGFYFNGKDPAGYENPNNLPDDGYNGKVIGMDQFGYNLVEGMVSGPLLMKKDSLGNKTTPILGFFLSVNYTDQLDPRPFRYGTNRITRDARDQLIAEPLRPTGTGQGTYHNSQFLSGDDFEHTPYRMNGRNRDLSAAGKIDVNVGPTVSLTFGGSMAYNNGRSFSYQNSLMNFSNFGLDTRLDWRVYGRYTQRYTPKQVEGSTSKIKSAFWSLMFDYSQSNRTVQDANHRDNLFNYGYVGKFTTHRRPSYEFIEGVDANGNDFHYWEHDEWQDYRVDFEASDINQAFSSITSQYYNIYDGLVVGNTENLFQIQQGNALRNGDRPDAVYGIWGNIGVPYDFYSKTENSQIRLTGSGSINIGGHSLSLGFELEQRFDRGFRSGELGPIGLWQVARQMMNSHITNRDFNRPTWENYGSYQRVTYDRLNAGYGASNGVYGGQEFGDAQSFFDYNVRQELGYDVFGTDFIDIDAVDPNVLNLSMFSPDELFNSGQNFVEYWGYDHTGNRVKGETNINKYFNEFDENGNFKRHIGAFQPIYFAGYIMDKFAFDDIVFNVGVRVDVFDARQPVLKDPLLVYSANDVQAVRGIVANDPASHDWVVIPESMGDDYVVYVNDVNNPTSINGFRQGMQWYDASGTPISDPSIVVGSNGIAPWLINPGQTTPSADAFTAYKAQVNVMPRIAFSFPISDEASFFAHYDILTQRPNTGFRFSPIDFQYMQARNVIINNANLKPTTTIDYALGFQQVLSKTSAVKIEAFYREQRNQIQLMQMVEAYPNTYRTYGNRDFGTVKGLTVGYDLRRTGNVRLTANYTLQFADGTGSDANSALNLVNSGQPNLQQIFPYDYDQRHAFNFVLDYRYGEGKSYNGPTTKNGFQILQNTGLNIITNMGSGTPYSRQQFVRGAAFINEQTAGLEGTLNGSRKPWTYTLDMQLDRTFNVEFGKGEDKKKMTFLNVYVRVTNILNTSNILNVYRATGNANDDGYLAASDSQSSIQNQLDEEAFREMYFMKVNNPYNYGLPRTIRLGVKFDF
jgi:hypothetical protein